MTLDSKRIICILSSTHTHRIQYCKAAHLKKKNNTACIAVANFSSFYYSKEMAVSMGCNGIDEVHMCLGTCVHMNVCSAFQGYRHM